MGLFSRKPKDAATNATSVDGTPKPKTGTLVGPYRYVLANAERFADKPALIHGPEVLTFSKVHELASQIGSAMRSNGLRPGQTVLLSPGTMIWEYIFSLAVMHEGAVVAFSTSGEYNPAFRADIAFTNKPVRGFPEEKRVQISNEWLKSASSGIVLPPRSFETENPIVRLVETSGTTGVPKVLEFDFDVFIERYETNSAGTLGAVGIEENLSRSFNQLPFRSYGGSMRAYSAIKTGHPFYMTTSTRDEDLRMFAHYKIEHLVTSPSRLAEMFRDDSPQKALENLKSIVTTGSAIPDLLIKKVKSRSKAVLINRLGSTEAGGVAWREVTAADEGGLAGKVYSWADLIIVDEKNNRMATGETGRIGIKTPYMRANYRLNPLATEQAFVDGYFFAGDEGYLDDAGNLFLVGRTDERINAGGVKLDPSLLDDVVLAVPGVKDAAIFGFDRVDGLRGIAVAIVTQAGQEMSMVAPAVDRALGSKRASAYIEVREIPRNLMGKVQRLALEKMCSNDARKLASN